MNNIPENASYGNPEGFLADALEPLSQNDVSDVADAITAVLRVAAFKGDHARILLAALGAAYDENSSYFETSFAALGARLSHEVEPDYKAMSPEVRQARKLMLEQRWRRAYKSLKAEQMTSGLWFVTCQSGGLDEEKRRQKSSVAVDVETFAEVVKLARRNKKFKQHRRRAFEFAAEKVLENKERIYAEPPDLYPISRPRNDEQSQMTRDMKGMYTYAKRVRLTAIRSGATEAEQNALQARMYQRLSYIFSLSPEQLESLTGANFAPTENDNCADESSYEEPTVDGFVCKSDEQPIKADYSVSHKEGSGLIGETAPAVFLEKEGNTGGALDAALAAVTAFESVGADSFVVTIRDEVNEKVDADTVTVAELRSWLPNLLQRNEAREESLIIRPRNAPVIQIDDLDSGRVEQLKPYSFLTMETSPGNYQAWVAVADSASLPEIRSRLLKELGGDTAASGATRLPGSLNRKPKHRGADGSCPRVRLSSVASSLHATVSELEGAGLLGSPLPAPPAPQFRPKEFRRGRVARAFPSYERCLADKAGNRSMADASFLKICDMRGFSMSEAIEELKRVAGRKKLERSDYLKLTTRLVNKS